VIPAADTTAFNIGRESSGVHYANASIAGVAYWNREFSSSDVLSVYRATQATTTVGGYQFLSAPTARWANLGTASTTYTLASSGLATGSKLGVTYRDARL